LEGIIVMHASKFKFDFCDLGICPVAVLASVFLASCAVQEKPLLPEEVVGSYVGSYAPTVKNVESGRCMSGTGVATVTSDGTFSARMTADDGQVFTAAGQVDAAQNISARFMASGSVAGSLAGTISGGQMNITYSSLDGCEGTGTGVKN
jgi:hypothetical protein